VGDREEATNATGGNGFPVRWAVEVQRTSLDWRNLGDLVSGLGFRLFDAQPFPALTSGEMDSCSTASEVFTLAKRLRAAMTGSAGIDSEFRLGSVIDYSTDPPKRHAFLEVDSARITLRADTASVTVKPPEGLTGEEFVEWQKLHDELEYQTRLERQRARLEPAFHSESATEVLELLGRNSHDGGTLYRIYELIEGHPNNRSSLQIQFGIAKDEFERFQDAVHNYSVSGRWARHAYHQRPRTANPMSKHEAEAFVRRLASLWLERLRRPGGGQPGS
jgi:hypothetical protein